MLWFILRQLKSSDSSKRIRAVESLGASAKPEAFDYLVTALADTDFGVRKAAVQALGSMADPRAVEPLLSAIEDDSASVREAAIQAIDMRRDARAVTPLVASLKDKDAGIRKAAADALERSWGSESKQALEDYRRREEEARHQAEEARAKRLAEAEEARAKRLAEEVAARRAERIKAILEMIREISNNRHRPNEEAAPLLRELTEYGPDALEAYAKVLKQNFGIIEMAIPLLARFKDPRVITLSVRYMAEMFLSEWMEPLLTALAEVDPKWRDSPEAANAVASVFRGLAQSGRESWDYSRDVSWAFERFYTAIPGWEAGAPGARAIETLETLRGEETEESRAAELIEDIRRGSMVCRNREGM